MVFRLRVLKSIPIEGEKILWVNGDKTKMRRAGLSRSPRVKCEVHWIILLVGHNNIIPQVLVFSYTSIISP
jgi:hypothetical protein